MSGLYKIYNNGIEAEVQLNILKKEKVSSEIKNSPKTLSETKSEKLFGKLLIINWQEKPDKH